MTARRDQDAGSRLATDAPLPADLRPWLVDLACRAGEAVMAVYREAFDVHTKADASPLTEADLASHRVLVEALRARTPTWPAVSEEDGQEVGSERPAHGNDRGAEAPADAQGAPGPRFWLIDPLDGTKEFANRNGEFTVNIALIEGGRPVLGVVHAPALGATYSAAEREGAFAHDAGGEERPIRTRAPEGGRAAVVASRSHANPDTEAFIAALSKRFQVERTSFGSSLKLCRVADGSAHYYPRLAPTMAWDTAAAHAVVEQAGGVVVDARTRRPLRYQRTPEDGWRNPPFLVLHAPDAWLPEEVST